MKKLPKIFHVGNYGNYQCMKFRKSHIDKLLEGEMKLHKRCDQNLYTVLLGRTKSDQMIGLWLFTEISKPMITCGTIVWWPRVRKAMAIKDMEQISTDGSKKIGSSSFSTFFSKLNLKYNKSLGH